MRHTVVHRNRITPGDHEKPSLSRTDGFSLLESLIALVVFSIGFLALTLLMHTSLQNTNSAFYRSVATEQAYDMADRIRANMDAVAPNDRDNIVNYGCVAAGATDPFCIVAGCSPAQVALYDCWQWNQTNQHVLPSGGGSIVPTAGTPEDTKTGAVTVTVSWDDDRTGAKCAVVGTADCMSFVVEFIP